MGLSFSLVTAAHAQEFAVFADANLRSAVAGQMVEQGLIPAGSDGTTITASDLLSLKKLSAPGHGIVRLEGLERAARLASVDLSGNAIADIAPLSALSGLTDLDVRGNRIDLTDGSPALAAIAGLEASGAAVSCRPQGTDVSQPTLSSPAPRYGSALTFSAGLNPAGVAVSATSQVLLYHLETKTVTKKVKHKKKKVAVNYWRLRATLAMHGRPAGGLSVQCTLPYAGEWQAQVVCAGSADYESCTSTVTAFVVADPRIEPAIRWALHRLRSHAWDHYCLKFVGDCYLRGAHATVHRYSNAKQAAAALHASANRAVNAPRGACVFYDSKCGGVSLGHVGISLGNGTMISDFGSKGVKIMPIKCTLHYIGWAAPPISPPINDWKLPPRP